MKRVACPVRPPPELGVDEDEREEQRLQRILAGDAQELRAPVVSHFCWAPPRIVCRRALHGTPDAKGDTGAIGLDRTLGDDVPKLRGPPHTVTLRTPFRSEQGSDLQEGPLMQTN